MVQLINLMLRVGTKNKEHLFQMTKSPVQQTGLYLQGKVWICFSMYNTEASQSLPNS